MLFGAIFCCLDSALTIAACLSYKSPFVVPFGKKEQADLRKREFSTGNSDHLTVLKAYRVNTVTFIRMLPTCFFFKTNVSSVLV
jgi:HrpA-like helicases